MIAWQQNKEKRKKGKCTESVLASGILLNDAFEVQRSLGSVLKFLSRLSAAYFLEYLASCIVARLALTAVYRLHFITPIDAAFTSLNKS